MTSLNDNIDLGCGLCCGWYSWKFLNIFNCNNFCSPCNNRITENNKILYDISYNMENKKEHTEIFNNLDDNDKMRVLLANYIYKYKNGYSCNICNLNVDNKISLEDYYNETNDDKKSPKLEQLCKNSDTYKHFKCIRCNIH
jgi:hypothetical protein